MHRILVADDVEINREILHDMLMEDYIVETAEDGTQAIQKLQEYRGGIAALLLDLQMPNTDGYAVLNWMNDQKWINIIPVLIISSERAVEVENYCFEMGVSDFIHKPFNSSIVKKRVDNIVELFTRKNAMAQTIAKQTRALEEQRQIIRLHTRQLRDTKIFNDLMMQYRSAIMVIEAKLKVLYERICSGVQPESV